MMQLLNDSDSMVVSGGTSSGNAIDVFAEPPRQLGSCRGTLAGDAISFLAGMAGGVAYGSGIVIFAPGSVSVGTGLVVGAADTGVIVLDYAEYFFL